MMVGRLVSSVSVVTALRIVPGHWEVVGTSTRLLGLVWPRPERVVVESLQKAGVESGCVVS